MKRIIGFFIFIFVLLVSIHFLQTWMIGESGPIQRMNAFYQLPDNQIDVVFMGASHVDYAIMPYSIWEQSGIPSFNYAQPAQNMWVTWHYLNELLKTQKPKVIFLETRYLYVFNHEKKQQDDHSFFSIDAMKWSETRWKASLDAYTRKKLVPYTLFPISNYHLIWMKYIETSKRILSGNYVQPKKILSPQYTMGYQYRSEVFKYQPSVELSYSTLSSPHGSIEYISGDNLLYFNLFVEKCKKENIQIVLFKVPYPGAENDLMEVKTEIGIELIAKENNLPYLNMGLKAKELGIDWNTDLFDIDHLNVLGAEKFTKYITEYLLNHHDSLQLIDKRSVAEYANWNIASEEFLTQIN